MKKSEKDAVRTFLQSRREILFAYLFGSQASGTSGPLSDADIAVYASTSLDAESRSRLLSDLMEPLRASRVDLVDLRQASPLLAYEVAASGELLFSRDAEAQNRFERKAFLHYFDTQHLRDVQNRYLRDSLRAS